MPSQKTDPLNTVLSILASVVCVVFFRQQNAFFCMQSIFEFLCVLNVTTELDMLTIQTRGNYALYALNCHYKRLQTHFGLLFLAFSMGRKREMIYLCVINITQYSIHKKNSNMPLALPQILCCVIWGVLPFSLLPITQGQDCTYYSIL